jgi:hypothetical protein
VAIVLALVGTVLRLVQYAARTSLWVDEAALARNVVDRPLRELLGPLSHAQFAPPGFLLVQKAAVAVFGNSEYALRAFPLVAGIVALWLSLFVARRTLRGAAVPIAVALFAFSPQLIRYSAEAKQYSSDGAIALLLALAALELRARGPTPRRAALFGALGCVTVWFSQPALFVLAAIGLSLMTVYARARDPRALRTLAITGVLWCVGAIPVVLLAFGSVSADDQAYIHHFWRSAFFPLPPRSLGDVLWPVYALRDLFSDTLMLRPSLVAAPLFVIGCRSLWLRRRHLAIALLAPAVIALAASALRVYPFAGQLLLFFAPAALLLTAEGVEYLTRNRRAPGRRLAGALMTTVLLVPCLISASQLPRKREELRPVLDYVRAKRQPGDVIYVYYGAQQAFRYYQPTLGLGQDDVIYGTCERSHWRNYLTQLDELRGSRRVWLVVTHPFRVGNVREDSLLVHYLQGAGTRLDAYQAPQAFAYLYDMSGRTQPSVISAAQLVAGAPRDSAGFARLCHGTMGVEENGRAASAPPRRTPGRA